MATDGRSQKPWLWSGAIAVQGFSGWGDGMAVVGIGAGWGLISQGHIGVVGIREVLGSALGVKCE